MTCGCKDNNKLVNNKSNGYKLSLESMQSLSIDEIINLYRQGYTLYNVDTTPEISNINALTYSTQCSGDSEIAFNNATQLQGTLGEVQRGKVWAQRFYGNFRCLEFVQFYMTRDKNISFHIEIRKDDGIGDGKPLGVPLVDDSGLIMRTPVISYLEIPQSPIWEWVYMQVAAILPADAYYWICFVPVDFFDSPTYRVSPTYDRFGLRDGTDIADKKSAVFKEGNWANSSTFAFAIFKKPAFIAQCISIINVSANPTTALIGEPVFLTTQASPSGQYTVEFYDTTTGTVLCSDIATISQTGYSCEWTPSTAGVFQIKARVVGQCTSPSATQVTINCSPMVSGVTANPMTVQVGQQVTLTSMVIPSGAYTIQFIKTDGTILASDTSSTSKSAYTATWTPTIAGVYDIVAKTSIQPLSCANQPVETVTVNPAQATCTAISLIASPTSGTIGDTITLTATTTPAVSGFNVTFKDSTTTLGTGTTNSSGVATYAWNTTGQTAGSHSLTANVSTQCTSSPPTTVNLTVPSQPCTAITLYANPTSGTIGTTINLTATVTNPPNTAGFSVTFKDGTTTLGTGTTNSSGVATYAWNTTGQTAGSHSLTANVSTQCTSSPPTTVNLTVPSQPCTAISLVANPTSVQQGQSITLTATVTNPPNTAGYNIDFKVDGYLVATRTTNSSGVATYSLNTSSLTVATHNITANVGTQCTSSPPTTINVTIVVAGAGGGGIVIMAVAALAAAMFMTRKPSQEQKSRSPDHRIAEKPR